jgi:hypothetical protein
MSFVKSTFPRVSLSISCGTWMRSIFSEFLVLVNRLSPSRKRGSASKEYCTFRRGQRNVNDSPGFEV